MTKFEVCLRYPNIGNPCLVRKASGSQDSVFGVLFGGVAGDLDMRSHLQGNVFLQRLPDTSQVIQKRAILPWDGFATQADLIARWSAIWDIDNWPASIRERLIPLEIVDVYPATHSPWKSLTPRGYKRANVFHFRAVDDGSPNWLPHGNSPEASDRWYPEQFFLDRDFAYWVILRIPSDHVDAMKVPQLFNFIQKYPADGTCSISYHSVYVYDNEWNSFTFIHATDSHIAWRNEFIQPIVRQSMGDPGAAEGFINYNEMFRKFINHTNQLHRQGQCDFVLLTGDLVDFIGVKTYTDEDAALDGRGRWASTVPGFAIPQDNFELFSDLVTAWPKFPGSVVGEELEAPLFTILGNHDYRELPYPLISTYRYWLWFGYIYHYYRSDFGEFGLTEGEARAYETGSPIGIRYNEAQAGVNAQSHLDHVPDQYRARLNPDPDYFISLGPHRIICLASGADSASITGAMDALLGSGQAREDLKDHTGHGEGFSQQQILFVQEQVSETNALIFLACHHPLFNFRRTPDDGSIPPPHVFRETEHQALDQHMMKELRDILGPIFAKEALNLDLPQYTIEAWAAATGWSLQNTPYFLRGSREPDLTNGAPDNHFNELMNLTCQETESGRKVHISLFLAGHTHRSAEFSAYPEKGAVVFLHDYYIDGTVNRHSPSEFWNTILPDYADSLSKTNNPEDWWRRHSPLFVQTISVAAPAGGDKERWGVGYLRITIKDNVVAEIKRESHLEPVEIPRELMILALESAQRLSSQQSSQQSLAVTLVSFILE